MNIKFPQNSKIPILCCMAIIVTVALSLVTYTDKDYALAQPTKDNSTSDTINISSNGTTNKSSDIHSTMLSNNSILIKPSSMEKEHKEIHEKLESLVSSTGNTAAVAKEVQSVLQPHFEEEEKLSITVLGAFQPYVNGTLTEEARDQAIQLSQQFKQKYPTMLEEHKQIVSALSKLESTAISENRQDALSLISELRNHAMNEEQVTYPATIVIGELLELKK